MALLRGHIERRGLRKTGLIIEGEAVRVAKLPDLPRRHGLL